jgi:hypothetical protein
MEVFTFQHVPQNKYAYTALFCPARDLEALKRRIINAAKAAQDEKEAVNFAFIDPSLVSSSQFPSAGLGV